MEIEKYNLKITKSQSEIIMLALDLYTRLSIGQFHNLKDISFEKNEKGINRKPSEETLKKLHLEMFPSLISYNSSYGIHSPKLPDKVKEGYDIYKVMMYEFNKHEGIMNVYSDKVRQTSNKPLPLFNKIIKAKKEVKMTKSKIVDIFEGEMIGVWKDEDEYFLSTPFATLNFDEEMWEALKRDLVKLSEL